MNSNATPKESTRGEPAEEAARRRRATIDSKDETSRLRDRSIFRTFWDGMSLPSWTGIDSSDLNASGGGSFKGAGDASQASSIRADLTVSIVEVRPNGTALVRGEKVMQLSQGEEWVQLSGIIRLADIDQDNRIPSIRVADARISYSGAGSVQRASREGWLSRFIGVISPF